LLIWAKVFLRSFAGARGNIEVMRVFLLLVFLACWPGFGDEVKLKNGDRLTGTVTRFDSKELTITTEYAGDVKIKRESVLSVETTDAVNVSLKDGQSLVGRLKLAGEKVEVSSETIGTVSAREADMTLFRNKADQEAYLRDVERAKNPRLVDLWTGAVDLGYAQARGNAQTNTISSAAKVLRTTSRDSINVFFQSLYSKNQNNGLSVLAANSIRGGLKYDLNITPKMYTFGSTDLEFDEFQRLDLRFVPAGGLGYHWFKTKKTTWDLFGGGSLNREFFNSGLNRTSGEVLAGNELTHRFAGMFTLSEKIVFYNNVTTSGNYRLNGDVAFAAAIKKWLSYQVTASNRYLSNPLPGRKTNDLVITTGVRLVFVR
jgi:putative salt-induced outer membrane protein YdiY/small nuclear ribonucleoprotein (snRNP)-like protein